MYVTDSVVAFPELMIDPEAVLKRGGICTSGASRTMLGGCAAASRGRLKRIGIARIGDDHARQAAGQRVQQIGDRRPDRSDR